jgi:GNAT superfamily N-acetyltransferase
MKEDRFIKIREGAAIEYEQLLDLYDSVGWLAYTSEERRGELEKAIQNSTYVVSAWDGKRLVGLARGLSDDVSIFYLQDVLVHPVYQRQGIGRRLLQECLRRFSHVRTKVLLTDDEGKQHEFYESMGYRNTRTLMLVRLNAYVQIEGLELA